MRQLKHLDTEKLINWYDDIVASKNKEKHKAILLSCRQQIRSRYLEYLENFSSEYLIKIPDAPSLQQYKTTLESCYKSEGKILGNLKDSIRKIQTPKAKGMCQYCCVGKPKSFDHFLPQSDYPEFAVLAINMIPCCKECNEKKKAYWKEKGERGIINFYLDELPKKQFLFVKLFFNKNFPYIIFELRNDGNAINVDLFKIIKKHFKRLDLFKIYMDEVTDDLVSVIQIISSYSQNPTINNVRQSLLKEYKIFANDYGENYWKAVVRLAMANSKEFISYAVQNTKMHHPKKTLKHNTIS